MMNDLRITGPRLVPGSHIETIFHALPLDDWMERHHIAEKTGIAETTISPALTHLYRSGWIEYQKVPGQKSHVWRRRPNWAEPQQNIHSGRSRKKAAPPEPTVTEHLEHARYHINQVLDMVGDLEVIHAAALRLGVKR